MQREFRGTFGDFLAIKRKEADLTIKDMANRLKISAAYYSYFESGDRKAPERDVQDRIKAFLAELKKRKTPLVEFDPLVWQATVSEMVVNADMTVMFKFRDGTELPWTIETGIHKYKKRDKAKSPNEQEAE